MDLVDLAVHLRDRGMSLAAGAQNRKLPKWSDVAYEAIERVARRQATVHVDDILQECPARPAHPNAWGAVWMRAIRAGLIARTGTVRPCTVDPGKHNHQYPVYRSCAE